MPYPMTTTPHQQSAKKTAPLQVNIPADEMYIGPTVDYIVDLARRSGVSTRKRKSLADAMQSTLQTVVSNQCDDHITAPIGISVEQSKARLVVEIMNHGRPMPAHLPTFHGINRVSVTNRGRDGQSLRLELTRQRQELNVPTNLTPIIPDTDAITFRALEAGEEIALSQLFHRVYGYDYIHDFVYFPELIAKKIRQNKLIAMVASNAKGQILGHVGLLQWNDTPLVFEPCLGIIDPQINARGLFSKLYQYALETVRQRKCHYCFFDAVTNHSRSQRMIIEHGARTTALFIGCQRADTQAKLNHLGLGSDPAEMDRYTLLYAIMPTSDHPFGTHIQLPFHLGEMLGFILPPLGVHWTPASRFSVLGSGGSYKTNYQPNQRAVYFELHLAGRQALATLARDWHRLLREDYIYAAVDVPVQQPGLANIYEELAAHGFFVAGFIPWRHGQELALRFQAIAPKKVAFNQIKVYGATAQKLLAVIQADYERNRLL